MIFKHQKIILTLELIAVIAATIYSGGHALNAPAQAAAETVVETETESVKKTAKESKEESETKKSKEKKTAKETRKKVEKPETKAESETVKKVAENKDNASSGNTSVVSGNNTDNNSSAPAVGTSSEPAGNTASSTRPSGNNNSQPSGTGSNTPSPSGGTSTAPATPSPSTPQTQAPETTSAHKHNWIEKTCTVHHDATGHYEDVVVQEAWDEPVYETVWKSICNGCGADITSNPSEHIKQQMLAGNMACSGHTDMPYEEIMGYTHHDAVTESRWVEDTPAWDETVSNGYVCSGCGATK